MGNNSKALKIKTFTLRDQLRSLLPGVVKWVTSFAVAAATAFLIVYLLHLVTH